MSYVALLLFKVDRTWLILSAFGFMAEVYSLLEWPELIPIRFQGWCTGSLDMDDFYLRSLAVELSICIVNVDYRCVACP